MLFHIAIVLVPFILLPDAFCKCYQRTNYRYVRDGTVHPDSVRHAIHVAVVTLPAVSETQKRNPDSFLSTPGRLFREQAWTIA